MASLKVEAKGTRGSGLGAADGGFRVRGSGFSIAGWFDAPFLPSAFELKTSESSLLATAPAVLLSAS